MGDRTRFWTKWRARFRFCRICVWLVILALLCVVLWLNQIGLPDFVKRPLLQALRERGIELQFVRLRLDFLRGLVADNVRIGGETPNSPSLTLEQLQLQINYRALLRRKWQLDGVVLRRGKFTLPISATNEPPSALTFDHIQTDLRFQTNDVWSLDNFQANFAGAKFILAGELTNASTAANWGLFHQEKAARGEVQARFKKIATALSQIHFDNGSLFRLKIMGDGRDVHSVSFHLAANAPGAETPWGSASNVTLVAQSIALPPAPGNTSTPLPAVNWKARLTRLVCDKLDADFISCGGSWRTPVLEVTNLFAQLGGGELRARAQLNLATREFWFTNSSCFDLQAITAFLTDKIRARIGQFSLTCPPQFWASGSMILPDWTNRTPDVWQDEVRPTIRLNGELAVSNAAFSGFAFDQAHVRYFYSNEIWTLPQAVISRPEGPLEITGTENDATKDYQWQIHGKLAPGVIQPFLTPKAERGFEHFTFAQPLFLDARVRGRLYDYDNIQAEGHLALTNFSIRGESVDSAETDFRYANRVADFFQPRLQAPDAQTMRADGIRLDFPGDRIYFTNGLGTAYPQQVANAIGPITARVMAPYHFLQPPTAQVNGYAPLRDSTNADLDFKIVGTAQLECLKVKTPAISGEIHWIRDTLVLTNLDASLYDGTGRAHAFFDFRPLHSADFWFVANVQNVDVHLLATDLGSPTNHLEGRLSGHFVVTSGNSADWRTCNGYGSAELRDGLIWDEPIFGMFSPVLNLISPGLGNSRATDASAQFFMTNGIVSTDSLQVHTALMRLRYNGTVDLRGRVNADVTAELLRDVRGVGPVASAVFWPLGKVFEYKVTGTWAHPNATPKYLPKFLFYLLHPLHTLQDWLPNQTAPLKPSPAGE